LKKGSRAQYYEVEYDLGLIFGPELVLEFQYREQTIERISAQYVA
jgi:hypothetical protein